MVKYILKLLLLFSPVIFVVMVYLIKDPFQVLYHYDVYLPSNKTINVQYDKDYISTQNFINKYDKYHYESYIFGNSRSMYYHIDEWKKHVDGNAFYHFDASGENLYGLEKKIEFLDKKSVKIKNALFVIDEGLLSGITNPKSIALIKHPELSGQSYLDFQLHMFKSYADLGFLKSYLYLLTFHKYKPSMNDFFISAIVNYNNTTNEETFPILENAILNNRDSFYEARKHIFYSRTGIAKYEKKTIDSTRKKMLVHINDILVKNKTNFKIVISPMYNQIAMDTTDFRVLKEIFGSQNVYNFSGINDITNNKYNYYEDSHYRPFIANQIMDSIYKK